MGAYDDITKRIIEDLERNGSTCPWRRPWTTLTARNAITGHKYRGINRILLSMDRRFSDSRWLTFKQCQAAGGMVKRGEKSTQVVFYDRVTVKATTEDEDDKRVPILKFFNLFNVSQCSALLQDEGGKIPNLADITGGDAKPIDKAQRILDQMPNPPQWVFGTDFAGYKVSNDTIYMPYMANFVGGPSSFYFTAFHECSHASGSANRLARPGIVELHRYGSPVYSTEELCCELSASFLSSECQLTVDFENTASYLKSWLEVLKASPIMLLTAASAAEKATAWILGEPA